MVKISPKSISQHKIKRYRELLAAQAELKTLKQELINMVDSGLPCQPGRFVLNLKTRAGSKRPSWKDEYIGLAKDCDLDPDVMVEGILNRTLPGAPSKSLEVIDREMPGA